MTDQTELNVLLVDNLADLEAAGHHIVDQLTPLVEGAAVEIVEQAVAEAGWQGEFDDFDNLCFAPAAWHEPGAAADEYLCHFEYRPSSKDQEDWYALSALISAGVLSAGFYLVRQYGGGTIAWSKLLAEHKASVAGLEQLGVLYDHEDDRAFHIPIRIEREAFTAGLRAGTFHEALAPFARAVEIAQAAEPLLEPIVHALRAEAMK